jgi:hypothetical protein
MAVTLAQAKLNVTDAVDINIIDEFQKSNDVLNRLTFDPAVSPAGGGATLTYSYTRQITQRGAAFRAIGSEYTPAEATKARYSVDLKPLGGSFQIDRVLDGIGQSRETAFQMRELIKASSAQFNDSVFNGDTAVDANGFDGLSKILTASSTEYLPLANGTTTGYRDWTVVDTKAEAIAEIEQIDAWLSLLDSTPDAIYGPKKVLSMFKRLAMWADQYEKTTDAFGRVINTYNGIPLIDPGTKSGSNTDVIALAARDADAGGAGGSITGLGDLYAVRYGLDGFHAVSTNGSLVRNWMPDFNTSGAVKTGEAELGPVAVVLKKTKAAGVFRNIKVS